MTSDEVTDLAERVHRRVREAHRDCHPDGVDGCALRAVWVEDVQEILDAVAAETEARP